MDSFKTSCNNYLDYPKNLDRSDLLQYNLQSHHQRLHDQGKRLFDNDQKAAVDFLESRNEDSSYLKDKIHSMWGLKQRLKGTLQSGYKDPKCRYVFITAAHSRAPLQISSGMLCLLFTYHQVMPAFLDFIFPFGKQIYPLDIHFSGLREEIQLNSQQTDTKLAELGRSGNELRLCYNLRSVERTSAQSGLPWSIRQAAVYQTFDSRTGRALWIFVKGNQVIRDRVTEASGVSTKSVLTSIQEAFSAILATHLLICDWSGENWRWYINDLENQLQVLTRGVLATQIEKPPTPITSPITSDCFTMSPRSKSGTFASISRSGAANFSSPSRTSTNLSSVKNQTAPLSPIHSSQAPTLHGSPHCSVVDDASNVQDRGATTETINNSKSTSQGVILLEDLRKWELQRLWSRWAKRTPQSSPAADIEMHAAPTTSDGKLLPEELPPLLNKEAEQSGETFTFSDLQRLHYIEEKAQEVQLVLNLNTEVLVELRQHYKHATNHSDFPTELKNGCQEDLLRFDRRVLSVTKDLGMLQSRIQNLLQLLANRKDLINDILQYRSVKASESLAKKSQMSADNIESLTLEMHEIAKKTKQETVSMRVITLVTLFFLPATFIATFMSTDILKFDHGVEDFQSKGLRVYLAIAAPLTMLTFGAWYVIHRMAKKQKSYSAMTSQYTAGPQVV